LGCCRALGPLVICHIVGGAAPSFVEDRPLIVVDGIVWFGLIAWPPEPIADNPAIFRRRIGIVIVRSVVRGARIRQVIPVVFIFAHISIGIDVVRLAGHG